MAERPGSVTRLKLYGSLDLAKIADIVLDAAVPDLADAASVFAVDRLLFGAEPRPGEAGDRVTVRCLGMRLGRESRETMREIFPAGRVMVLDANSPHARCLRGEPMVFAGPDSIGLQPTRHGGGELLSRYPSGLVLPAASDGQVLGFLGFARTAGSRPFSGSDITVAEELAAGVGVGLGNAVSMLRQKTVADTLQRTLLAAEPEVPPGIEAAARCFPAKGHVVGGDWYDMVALPGGRSGLIVGDVMGHGPEAAAVMAHLRSAAHSLAQLDLEPAELLGQLDRTTSMLRDPVLATCVYAVMDPEECSCTLAMAGHLSPALAMLNGVTHVPDLPSGQSLGLGSGTYGQARIRLRPGTVLALYTDGLVETSTRPFEQGVQALQTILAGSDGDLETACLTLITSLAQRHEDDVTVVLARCL
ncbi:MAG: SpoIIE family protein phosphatase [Streptosporangiales bacterium]|nr:SpoIIE family protein phosphatase [Streptosporangiales bacterium]